MGEGQQGWMIVAFCIISRSFSFLTAFSASSFAFISSIFAIAARMRSEVTGVCVTSSAQAHIDGSHDADANCGVF